MIGDEGAGKTLSMSAFGALLSEVYEVPLAANYPMFGVKNFTWIQSFEQLKSFENGIFLFDEMWESMDSRLPKNNILLSHWVKQSRKKKLLMFYSTQGLDQIDKRVKIGTKIIMYCVKVRDRIVFHFCDGVSGNLKRSFTIQDPSQFYSLYDTDRVVDLFSDL